MAEEAAELDSGVGVPQADDGVQRTGRNELSIRADGNAVFPRRVRR